MPNVGSYIVRMIQDRLNKVEVEKWAWDRDQSGAACEMYLPTRDLKDIKGYHN
jgi:sarcosine oxidase / L-pipecolate oxidase